MSEIINRNRLSLNYDTNIYDVIWGVAVVPEYKVGFWEGNLFEGECVVIKDDKPLLIKEKDDS